MFLKTLRQLHIRRDENEVVLEYKCIKCEQFVVITLSETEYDELKEGIPFNSVFQSERRNQLLHFKQGTCKQCLPTQPKTK